MAWTDERVDLLKKLWGEGKSASRIAKELGGVTRNAVIGKVHRLGLSNRTSGGDKVPKPKTEKESIAAKTQPEPQAAKPEPDRTPVAPQPTVLSKPPSPTQIVPAEKRLPPQPNVNEISPAALASHREVRKKALRLSLMELTERTCKWPFGDPASDDFWFCGLPVEPGKCYCKPCAEVAYQSAPARRDRRR